MSDTAMPSDDSAKELLIVSPHRRLITSGRFLEALTRVEIDVVKTTPTLEKLFDTFSEDFQSSSFSTIQLRPPDLFEEHFARPSRGLRSKVDHWLDRHRIGTPWTQRIALYTLLVRLHRPTAFHWSVPPLPLTTSYERFRFEAEGFHTDFEIPSAARKRLRKAFAAALDAHIDHVTGKTPLRKPVNDRHEKRDLEWLALHQVHSWSVARIARASGLGNPTRAGGTGRANVERALKRWRSLLDLPKKG